jgi:hypothetical protein
MTRKIRNELLEIGWISPTAIIARCCPRRLQCSVERGEFLKFQLWFLSKHNTTPMSMLHNRLDLLLTLLPYQIPNQPQCSINPRTNSSSRDNPQSLLLVRSVNHKPLLHHFRLALPSPVHYLPQLPIVIRMRSGSFSIQCSRLSQEETPRADTEQNPYPAICFLWQRHEGFDQIERLGLPLENAGGASSRDDEDVEVCELGVRLGDRDVALESQPLACGCELGDGGYGVREGFCRWRGGGVRRLREDLEGAGEVESVEAGVDSVENLERGNSV